MRVMTREGRKRRIAAIVIVVIIIAAVVWAVFGLTAFIDRKLKQSAEQQVVTFTEQAASGVSDRMFMAQSALSSFTVQTADPKQVVPALRALVSSSGFAKAAYADMGGTGYSADGAPFSVDDLARPDTALAEGRSSFSDTFLNKAGGRVRLAQRPLYIDGRQVGALYVQIPLNMFSMARQIDMFDGRGYFLLFEASTGEVLVPPADAPKTPIPKGSTLYEFLDAASRYTPPAGGGGGGGDDDEAFEVTQPQRSGDLDKLRRLVENRQAGFTTSSVDGKANYVCVAPVGSGKWYACSIVPVANVRAEAAVVSTAFEMVFAVIFACLLVVALLVFAAYRRRLRERNVAMLSELYDAMSDSIDMAVNLYSPADGKVAPIVAKAQRIIGYRMDEFIDDRRLAESIELSTGGLALFDRIRSGTVMSFEEGEFSFRSRQSGKKCWASYAVKPLMFDEKRQLLFVLRDVTSEKAIQLSMKDAMDVAEAANAAKSAFLSRMSHEIRTPMNVIIGMLQIARNNIGDGEKMAAILEKIGAASDHLLGLINDVLDISKIEHGKMTLASKAFRLSALLFEVSTVIRAQCEQRGQRFVEGLPSCADAVFVGDAVRIRQLLINLLSNAVKYTPEHGCVRFEASLSRGVEQGFRRLSFTVEDDGIGMSQEFVEHLFEPFSMEGRSREQGTGLGMTIVKNIVSMLAGDIEVKSEPGKGTRFTVAFTLRLADGSERAALEKEEREAARSEKPAVGGQLAPKLREGGPARVKEEGRPAKDKEGACGSGAEPPAPRVGGDKPPEPPAPPAPRVGGDEPPEPPAPREGCDPRELEGLRVLLAEDNDLNAEIATELLGEAGLVVRHARDGQEACELFEASAAGGFDVVLMDVQMPRLNGYEATRRIRSLDRADASGVPIIAMSANAFSEDVEASLASGMNAHLSKPIDIRRVLDAIAQHVRNRREKEEGKGPA